MVRGFKSHHFLEFFQPTHEIMSKQTVAKQVADIYNANWSHRFTTYTALIEHMKTGSKYGLHTFVIECDHMQKSDINELFEQLEDDGFVVTFYNGDHGMLEITW